jgi:glutamate dehydrogenase
MRAREAAGAAERRRILGAARRALRSVDAPTIAGDLMNDLFGRVGVEDLRPYSPAEIASFASSAATLLERHRKGQHEVRVSTPDFGGRSRRHQDITLIEILNDDMPFLVDSILGELQESGAAIRLVAQPVLAVERDRGGRLTGYNGLASAEARGRHESLMTIHIDRLVGDDARKELARRLDTTLVDIRRAVADWRPMLERGERAIGD